jgi:hypothetical protein
VVYLCSLIVGRMKGSRSFFKRNEARPSSNSRLVMSIMSLDVKMYNLNLVKIMLFNVCLNHNGLYVFHIILV